MVSHGTPPPQLQPSACLPAPPRTTCASIERLILLEQTTPNDNNEGFFLVAVGGGNPGGVDGRTGSPATMVSARRVDQQNVTNNILVV
jgi:hypothetical protein